MLPISTLAANDKNLNILFKYIFPNTDVKNTFLHEHNYAVINDNKYTLIGDKTTIEYDDDTPHLNHFPHYIIAGTLCVFLGYKIIS